MPRRGTLLHQKCLISRCNTKYVPQIYCCLMACGMIWRCRAFDNDSPMWPPDWFAVWRLVTEPLGVWLSVWLRYAADCGLCFDVWCFWRRDGREARTVLRYVNVLGLPNEMAVFYMVIILLWYCPISHEQCGSGISSQARKPSSPSPVTSTMDLLCSDNNNRCYSG